MNDLFTWDPSTRLGMMLSHVQAGRKRAHSAPGSRLALNSLSRRGQTVSKSNVDGGGGYYTWADKARTRREEGGMR